MFPADLSEPASKQVKFRLAAKLPFSPRTKARFRQYLSCFLVGFVSDPFYDQMNAGQCDGEFRSLVRARPNLDSSLNRPSQWNWNRVEFKLWTAKPF
jgi:hypothetical protein